MPDSRLSALQERVLDVLAGLEPAWTLFGAGDPQRLEVIRQRLLVLVRTP